MTLFAVDTSVVVPLLVRSHDAHERVQQWRRGKRIALSGHAAVESFSVLTRLGKDLRVGAGDARRMLTTGFEPPVSPSTDHGGLVERLAALDITGGAVYDALVAIAAVDADLPLATLDARAVPTYARIGVRIEIIA